MTPTELIKDVLIPLFCVGCIPVIFKLFRDIRSLELGQVEMKKEAEKLEDKIDHLNGNYKQGIEHLNGEMSRMNDDIHEMKTDIKELLKYIYKNEQ